MANIIDALVVTLGLDSSNYQKGQKDVADGLGKLKEHAGTTAKEMEARGKQAASFVGSIKTELLSLFALVTAGKGLTSFITDSISGTAALGRMAASLNMSARELDGWGTAAEAFGGTAEGVRGSLQGIAAGIQDFALTGESALVPVFRSMGIAITDSEGKVRDYREILLDVADKFKGMSAQEAINFGKRLGLDDGTINLLRQGRAAVTDMVGQMTAASGITDESVAAAQRAQKSWAIFNQQMRGVGQTIFTELAPALDVAVVWLTQFSGWITSHHDDVVTFFAAAAAGATLFALATIEIWGPIVLVAAAIAALSAGVTYLWQEWKTWTDGGQSSLGDLFQVASDVFKWIKEAWDGAVGPMSAAASSWLEFIKSLFKLLVAIFTGTTDDMRAAWKKLFSDFGDFFYDFVAMVENLAPKIGEAIKKAFLGAFDSVKGRYEAFKRLFTGESDGETPEESGDSGSGTGPVAVGDSASVVKKFVAMGWTPEQAAGIAANLKKESEFNPSIVGDGGKAYGVAQWHPDRQADFKAWSGKDIRGSSLDEQLKFVDYELRKGKEKAAGDKLAQTSTARDAGAAVSRHYERPGLDEATKAREARERGALADAIASSGQQSVPQSVRDAIAAAGRQLKSPEAGSVPSPMAGIQVGASARAPASGAGGNTNSSEVNVGKIEIHTQAKDAEGIAQGIGQSLQQNGLVNQAATGDS